jgi:LuxR family maltose regulon positive regulatory protein
MREDAALALAELGPFSPFRAPAMWLRATASLLAGERAQAETELEDAAGAAEATGATFAGSTALAQRALLALGAGDVPVARAFVSRAHALVGREAFADYVPMAILLVADARTSIAEGDSARAEQALARAQPLRPYLTAAIPFYAVQTLAEMARAYLALDDLNGCRAVLVDAVAVLRQRPELGILVQDVEGLRTRAAEVGQADSGWESSLTAAELRLLPLLTTHLTFREIGDRLYVSRNTVKTQAISIYRKLGVSSRGEAVQRAAELGLVLAPGGITPSG